MIDFDFDYRSRRTEGPAVIAVEQIWYARGTVPYRSELIAPTGSTVALLVFGDPIRQTPANGTEVTSAEGLVIGPHTAPIENAPLGETFALGIVTTSVGCEPTIRIPPAAIRGRVVTLRQADPSLVDLRASIADELKRSPEAMLDRLGGWVETQVDLNMPGLERVAHAVQMLEEEPRRPIADIASAIGVTHPHLDREFNRIVGLTPRALARLLLLRRLLVTVDPEREISWADLAYEHGWADQAHFSRDFKRHTGVSPTAYLATQRAIAGAGSGEGAGFTPDLEDLR